jgi:hypothetical protein
MSLVLMVRGLTAARLSLRDPDRLRAVLLGFAMLSAWIAAIHSETPIAAPLTVLFSLATVGAAIVFERALARAEGQTGGAQVGAAPRIDGSRFEIGAAPTAGML